MLFNFCVNEIDGTVGIFVGSYINLKHFKSHFVIFVKLSDFVSAPFLYQEKKFRSTFQAVRSE